MKKIKNKLYVCKMHILRIYDRFETQIKSIALAIGIVAVIVIACIGLSDVFTASHNVARRATVDTQTLSQYDLIQIDNSDLYYHKDTKIVYMIVLIRDGVFGEGYTLMNEYYSENGKLCRYIDGQITEID